jgi:hypothetical protein
MAARAPDEEASGITELLESVKRAEDALDAALKQLGTLVRATAEPPLMPNYARAEDQLRTASRAAAGAETALRRRLQIARQRAVRRR